MASSILLAAVMDTDTAIACLAVVLAGAAVYVVARRRVDNEVSAWRVSHAPSFDPAGWLQQVGDDIERLTR